MRESSRLAYFGRSRRVLVLEVGEHVDSGRQKRSDPLRQLPELLLGVGRFAEAEVPKRRVRLPVVHAHRRRDLGAVPARVAEVECERQVRRAEQQREQAVVARALDHDPHRPEPVAEPPHALLERPERPQRPRRQLDREAEAVRHLRRPALELLLGRQPVPRRVQLHGGQARRIEGEELLGREPGRVEVRPPGGIRPARRADP